MLPTYDPAAPKKPTNLSINSDLLRRAKELNLNLSQTLEQALEQVLKQKQQAVWLEQNREAIKRYNEVVDQDGVFSDGLRAF